LAIEGFRVESQKIRGSNKHVHHRWNERKAKLNRLIKTDLGRNTKSTYFGLFAHSSGKMFRRAAGNLLRQKRGMATMPPPMQESQVEFVETLPLFIAAGALYFASQQHQQGNSRLQRTKTNPDTMRPGPNFD